MYCIYSRTVINIKKNMYYNNSEHSTTAGHQENILSTCIFSQGCSVFKNENVEVKVKYDFVCHTGLAGIPLQNPPSTF
jgi:hypothetical protein